MSENFKDNIIYSGSTLSVSGDAVAIGSTNAGAKSVIFNNTGSQGHLAWQPTDNRTINLPDSNGVVQLTGQVPGAIYDGANSITSGTIRFTNANGVSFSINGQTISGSVAAQSAQTQNVVVPSAGTQTATSGTIVFSNSNNVTFGMSGSSRITASYNFNVSAGTTSNNLNAITFSNSNGLAFGLDGATITGSYTVPTQSNQTAGLYALGNTTQNSSTTLDVRSLSFNGLGAASVGYSNGSIQLSVPVQTAQTQSNIAGVYDGVNSISTGTIRFTNANGVSFSINGQTISGSVAAQTNQTLGLYAVSNTTGQSSSSTFDARSLSFHGAGVASVGYSNGSVVVSVPSGGGGITNINVSAGTTSNNLSALTFSNSNGVSFGLNASTITASFNGTLNSVVFSNSNNIVFGSAGNTTITASYNFNLSAGTTSNNVNAVTFSNSNGLSFGLNGSTITGSYTVPTQTNQTVGLYAVSNTTEQSSSSTFDARSLSFNGAGNISVGYSAGSVIISGSGGGGGVALSAGTNSTSTGTVVFSNSNNITFGMSNNGVVTASFNANNTASTFVLGISTQGNTAGTTGFANQSVQLVGTNGVTLSQSINGNSATITIVGDGATVNKFIAFPPGQMSSSQQTNSQISFRYVYLDNYVSMTRLDVPMILSITSSGANNTGNIVFTSGCVIYTRNGSTLNPIVGTTANTTYTWASNTSNYSNIIGLRAASFPIATALTPGEYWVGVHISTTNNSSIGTATTQLANTVSMLCGSTYTALNYAEFGSTTGASSNGLFPMQGLCSISISNTTMTFQQSQISVSGVAGFRANIHMIFRNY
jgi:hypothetical protein